MVTVNSVTGNQPIMTNKLKHHSRKCPMAKAISCICSKLGPGKYSVAPLT